MFYVIRCPKCGLYQAVQPRGMIKDHTFKCKTSSCRATRQMKVEATFALSLETHGPYVSAQHAAHMVRALNTPPKHRKTA